MKKVYEKPEIVFESFSLSTNIAGDCSVINGNPSEGKCAMVGTGGINVFSSGIDACVFTSTELGGGEDTFDGVCYHIPIADSDLFNS